MNRWLVLISLLSAVFTNFNKLVAAHRSFNERERNIKIGRLQASHEVLEFQLKYMREALEVREGIRADIFNNPSLLREDDRWKRD